MKIMSMIVAGTGHDDRAKLIRLYCAVGARVTLRREPDNPHDPNAIAVLLRRGPFLGLIPRRAVKIGYVKAPRAVGLAKLMDRGSRLEACVDSFWAPPDLPRPRVSLKLQIQSD